MSGWKADVSGAIRCPLCPLCGAPPALVVGDSQAFCGNDQCRAMNWELLKTAAENLRVDPDSIPEVKTIGLRDGAT